MRNQEPPKQGTGGSFKRLAAKLRGRARPLPQPPVTASQNQVIDNDYNDRQRAQRRYEEAANYLKEAMKLHKGPGTSSVDFEELSGETEHFDDAQFRNKINAMLVSRETSIKDRNGWAKFTNAIECVFTAFSPFAKNFLTVAKNAQSVIPFSLF
jgi:hypothetical protein